MASPRRVGAVLLAVLLAMVATPGLAQEGEAAVTVRVTDPLSWKDRARLATNDAGLSEALAARSYRSPAHAVYLIEILPGIGQPAFVYHGTGQGGFWMGFYPMSAVKVAAAVGAVDWIAALGFTGDATVRFDTGYEARLADIYEAAITVSDNLAYDRLLQVAGLDHLNQELFPRFGLDALWIGAAYAGLAIQSPPGYSLTEEVPDGDPATGLAAGATTSDGTRRIEVSGRRAENDYRGWNDADLFDLLDVLRRLMLDDELPAEDRFGLPTADVARIRDALCRAVPDLLAAGAEAALGTGTLVCNKSGTWPSGTCIDHAYVEATDGRRFLIGVVAPCADWTPFVIAAEQALSVADRLRGTPLQQDAGRSIGLLVAAAEDMLQVELYTEADWALVWVDDRDPVLVAGSQLAARLELPAPGDHTMAVLAVEGGTPVGYRSVGIAVDAPG